MLADTAFLRGRTREPDTRTLKEAQDPPSVEATGNSSPKIRGTFGGPIIWILIYRGLYWGPLICADICPDARVGSRVATNCHRQGLGFGASSFELSYPMPSDWFNLFKVVFWLRMPTSSNSRRHSSSSSGSNNINNTSR